jgi:polysaccharide export outer membrane protein
MFKASAVVSIMNSFRAFRNGRIGLAAAGAGLLGIMLALCLAGCATTPPPPPATGQAQASDTNSPAVTTQAQPASPETETNSLVLKEGDVVNISFPGAPTLNKRETIRRDGKITLETKGEVQAAGLKPRDLEKKLLELYDADLVVKQITVTVETAGFPIYVSGAVLRPQKITLDHPVTVLQAIMEAGGYDPDKANLKKVKIIREQSGKSQTYILNLQPIVQHGGRGESFQLMPYDIIYVPQRFIWF